MAIGQLQVYPRVESQNTGGIQSFPGANLWRAARAHFSSRQVCHAGPVAEQLQLEQSARHRQLRIIRMRKERQHVEFSRVYHSPFCLITITQSPPVKIKVEPPLPARPRIDFCEMPSRTAGSKPEYVFLISPSRNTSALMSALNPGSKSMLRLPLARRISDPNPCHPRTGIVRLI